MFHNSFCFAVGSAADANPQTHGKLNAIVTPVVHIPESGLARLGLAAIRTVGVQRGRWVDCLRVSKRQTLGAQS